MKCGLIGGKLGHSYSKIIHEMLGGYSYDLLETPEDELERRLADRDYSGFNVTIPYKEAVMPFCAGISDEAREIGCVNTLARGADGGLFGYNTDLAGFRAMAERAAVELYGKKVLILGSGATSKTAGAAAKAGGASEIIEVSRKGGVTYGDLERHRDAQVIINTTPVGMYPENGEALVSPADFPKLSGVLDVIYNPIKTRLVQQAERLGIPCSGGLYMLVSQAVAAAEIFTGESFSDKIREIYDRLLMQVENIVLIGMPGSGKTSLGKLAAEKMGREFLDMDALIEKKAGMSIPELFEKQGEAGFRKIESEAAADCGKRSGVVIATGGGAPLLPENRESLCQNGRVFLLRRNLDKLETCGRPLSKDIETLGKMERERLPVYRNMAKAEIDNNGEPEEALAAIVEEFT